MRETLQYYRAGMKQFDACHPNSLKNRIHCITDEIREFIHEPSFEELWDVIHSGGRLIEYETGIWLFCLFAWTTVKKHAKRFQENGCPRSQRNSCGKCRTRGE